LIDYRASDTIRQGHYYNQVNIQVMLFKIELHKKEFFARRIEIVLTMFVGKKSCGYFHFLNVATCSRLFHWLIEWN